MHPRFFVFVIFISLAGCAHHQHTTRHGVMSQELPLTLDDLSEIRTGEQNHEKILWDYRVYQSPQLEKYCNAIAANLAEVSTRPHLPYHVVLLDTDEVNLFGGAGGYIYITRGFFDFVESEGELAGAMAHEIAHVANYEYSNVPHLSKMKFVYSSMLKGSEFAKDSIGSYGTALNVGLKGLGKAAPIIARRFTSDQEVMSDERAVDILVKAGYDPREFLNYVDRLAKVDMQNVGRFVVLMNTHPPFPDRRVMLETRIKNLALEKSKVEFKRDTLSEIRQNSVNAPDSIVFQPPYGAHDVPVELEQMERNKQDEMTPQRKRWSWY